MEQYGYCNFQQMGYFTASEDTFFRDPPPNRQQVLNELYNHISAANGDVSLLGLDTDLNSKDENPRYFFQCSGRLLLRNAAYAHGYVQQIGRENQRNLFGSAFLQLLCAPFMSGEEMERLAPDTANRFFPTLQKMTWENAIRPAVIPAQLLRVIVFRLLNRERVILRLKAEEAVAMGYSDTMYARAVLLTIYSALPYAARRSCGFCSNVAAERFALGSDNPLPGMVKLCLVSPQEVLPDRADVKRDLLTFDDVPPDIAREAAGQRLDIEQLKSLLNLLTDGDTPEKEKRRQEFFENAFEVCENGKMGQAVMLRDYLGVLPIVELMSLTPSAANMERQAAWYADNLRNKAMLRLFLNGVCKSITPQVMEEYLHRRAAEELNSLQEACKLITGSATKGEQEPTLRQAVRMFDGILRVSAENEADDMTAETSGAVERLSGILSNTVMEQVEAARLCHCALGEGAQPFATDRSVQLLQQYFQQVKETRIPFADRDNRILQYLLEDLNSELQDSSSRERRAYEDRLAKECAQAAAELQGAKEYAALSAAYHALCGFSKRYPVCSDAMARGAAFGSSGAYGEDALAAVCNRLKEILEPHSWQERENFFAVLEQCKQDTLAQLKAAQPLLIKAEKTAEELRKVEKILSEFETFADWLNVYHSLTTGTGWNALHPDMRQSVRCLIAPVLERSATLSAVLKNADIVVSLYAEQDLIFSPMVRKYLVVDLDTADPQQIAAILRDSQQWCRLAQAEQRVCGGKSPCRILAGGKQIMAGAQKIVELLQWMQPGTEPAACRTPEILPFLCENIPAWTVRRFIYDGARMDVIVLLLLQENSLCRNNVFLSALLMEPVWQGSAPVQLACCLYRQWSNADRVPFALSASWRQLMQGTCRQQQCMAEMADMCDEFRRDIEEIGKAKQERSRRKLQHMEAQYKTRAQRISVLLSAMILLTTLPAALLVPSHAAPGGLLLALLAVSIVWVALLGFVLLPMVKWKKKRYALCPTEAALISYLPAIIILLLRVL